ncbi:MAG: hypothetical protein ACTSO9_15175 [Candidatus Helarchaeota archaeon]
MKSAVEVIAHLFEQGLEGLPDRKQKILMNKLFGKVVQLTLMNYNEVVVFFFEELDDPNNPGKKRRWMRYESFPNPMIKCKKCGWNGFWNELPKKKMIIDVPEDSAQEITFDDMEEIVEKCPRCGSDRKLYYKDWTHPLTDVNLYVESQWEIGKFGTIMLGPIHIRLKALFNAVISMLKGKTKIVPFSKALLVFNFASMML